MLLFKTDETETVNFNSSTWHLTFNHPRTNITTGSLILLIPIIVIQRFFQKLNNDKFQIWWDRLSQAELLPVGLMILILQKQKIKWTNW